MSGRKRKRIENKKIISNSDIQDTGFLSSASCSMSDFDENEIYDETNSNQILWGIVTGPPTKNQFNGTDFGLNEQHFKDYKDKTPYDFYKLLVTNDIITYLVTQTNILARQQLETSTLSSESRLLRWQDVTNVEMERFIGFNIWMSLNRMPKISDYWSKNILYENNISKCMSRNRFELISSKWIFSTSDDNESITNSRLFEIQSLINLLVKNFKNVIIPGKEIYIKEILVPFYERLAFTPYDETKEQKTGVKLFKIYTKDGYTYDAKVYCGRAGVSIPTNVVLSLLNGLLDTGRILFTDNHFTSVHLAHKLLERNTHLVGKLNKKRKLLPEDVVTAKLQKNTLISRESNTGIVVIKYREKHDMLMLSTYHNDSFKDVRIGGKRLKKPSIIVDYNRCKAFADLTEQKEFGSVRPGIKWYKKIALDLLTAMAITNAHILYEKYTNKRMTIIKFKEQVTLELLQIANESQPIEPAKCELTR